jgi:hypothetical protein
VGSVSLSVVVLTEAGRMPAIKMEYSTFKKFPEIIRRQKLFLKIDDGEKISKEPVSPTNTLHHN